MKSALNILALVALSAVLVSTTAYANEYGNAKAAKTEVSDGAKKGEKADKAMKATKADKAEATKAEKAEDVTAAKMKKKHHHKKHHTYNEDPLGHYYKQQSDMDLWLHRECLNREHSWEYHVRHHSW